MPVFGFFFHVLHLPELPDASRYFFFGAFSFPSPSAGFAMVCNVDLSVGPTSPSVSVWALDSRAGLLVISRHEPGGSASQPRAASPAMLPLIACVSRVAACAAWSAWSPSHMTAFAKRARDTLPCALQPLMARGLSLPMFQETVQPALHLDCRCRPHGAWRFDPH